jgi:hypothetical protein
VWGGSSAVFVRLVEALSRVSPNAR